MSIFLKDEIWMELSELLRLTNLFAFAFCIRALGGDALGEKDGKEGDQDNERGNYICHGTVTRAGELGEDPDRQRRLLSCRKGGHDHFIKGKRKCQHASREQRRSNVGENYMTKCLEGIRPQVHRGFDL